jgi:hypothetical protein
MKHAKLLILGALAGCTAEPDVVFTNMSIALPEATAALPPGPHVEQVTTNCLSCHSAEMILTQPRLSKTAWEGEVAKMIKVYKAPVADTDVPAIVTYLVATNEALTQSAKTAPLPPPAPAECGAAPCRLLPMSSSPGR